MFLRTPRFSRPMLACVVAAASLGARSAAQEKAPSTLTAVSSMSLTTTPAHLVNGGPVFFRVTASQPLQSLKGTWLGHEVVFDHGNGKTWFLLAAVSLETKPGTVPLTLEGTTESGATVSYRRNVVVRKAKYPVV